MDVALTQHCFQLYSVGTVGPFVAETMIFAVELGDNSVISAADFGCISGFVHVVDYVAVAAAAVVVVAYCAYFSTFVAAAAVVGGQEALVGADSIPCQSVLASIDFDQSSFGTDVAAHFRGSRIIVESSNVVDVVVQLVEKMPDATSDLFHRNCLQ